MPFGVRSSHVCQNLQIPRKTFTVNTHHPVGRFYPRHRIFRLPGRDGCDIFGHLSLSHRYGRDMHAAAAPGGISMTGTKARIFIVDDHPLVREWLANLIEKHSDLTICGEAEDAPTALEGIAE